MELIEFIAKHFGASIFRKIPRVLRANALFVMTNKQ